jgi:hypothetical protein
VIECQLLFVHHSCQPSGFDLFDQQLGFFLAKHQMHDGKINLPALNALTRLIVPERDIVLGEWAEVVINFELETRFTEQTAKQSGSDSPEPFGKRSSDIRRNDGGIESQRKHALASSTLNLIALGSAPGFSWQDVRGGQSARIVEGLELGSIL